MTVMDLHNLFADRQTQAMAADLERISAPVKRFKYFIDFFGWNTDTIVFYLHKDILGVEIYRYPRGIILRKFTGIINQVQE